VGKTVMQLFEAKPIRHLFTLCPAIRSNTIFASATKLSKMV